MESEKYRIKISVYDRELILKYVLGLRGDLRESIRRKRPRLGEVTLELTQEELKEIAGWIAMEANHTTNGELEEDLEALYEHLESVGDEISRKW